MKTAAIIVTLGPWHDKPWWWAQLASLPLRDALEYERISLDNKTHKQIGLADLPRLAMRLARILRGARRRGVGYVITFESDLTCYLIGLLQRLPGLGGVRHVIVQFISGESNGSFASRLKDRVQAACLATVHMVVCSSRSEARYYEARLGWPPGKAAFVPLQTDERYLAHAPAPPAGTIVAAGRSYRDYRTLAEAVRGTGLATIIVCGRDGPGVPDLPAEIQVVSDVPLAELSDLLSAASVVAMPLLPSRISTGQMVLLQAMTLGKPVVATRTAGTEDYIADLEDGVLVPPGDPAALRAALVRLRDDADLRRRLGENARKRMIEGHLPRHYVAGVADVLGCGRSGGGAGTRPGAPDTPATL